MTVQAYANGDVDDREEPMLLFDALLYPNRSLSRRGFILLMAVVAAVSLTVGGFFLVSGAWPVFGLYGLDVAILYWAFRANYRDGGRTEQIRLTADRLTVERCDPAGRCSTRSFQPHWLNVAIDDPPQHQSQLVLSSHGQSLIVGAFLSPDERVDLAKALRAALDGARRPDSLPA